MIIFLPETYDPRDRPSVLVTSPGSPDLLSSSQVSHPSARFSNRLTPSMSTQCGPHLPNHNVGGRIQIKLGYDPSGQQLLVTIVGATNLLLGPSATARNPYVKVRRLALLFCFAITLSEIKSTACVLQIFLLPDRSEKTRRRTRTLANTCEPRWGQIFRYPGLRRSDLANKLLEVCIFRFTSFKIIVYIFESCLFNIGFSMGLYAWRDQ